MVLPPSPTVIPCSSPTLLGETERRAELLALRATTEEQTRAIRVRRLAEALDGLDCFGLAEGIRSDARRESTMLPVRDYLRTIRRANADGSNEKRFAAAGTALDALGALWCVS